MTYGDNDSVARSQREREKEREKESRAVTDGCDRVERLGKQWVEWIRV